MKVLISESHVNCHLQMFKAWTSRKFCHLVKRYILNSLPNDKILVWSKLKALADDKINMTEKCSLLLDG